MPIASSGGSNFWLIVLIIVIGAVLVGITLFLSKISNRRFIKYIPFGVCLIIVWFLFTKTYTPASQVYNGFDETYKPYFNASIYLSIVPLLTAIILEFTKRNTVHQSTSMSNDQYF